MVNSVYTTAMRATRKEKSFEGRVIRAQETTLEQKSTRELTEKKKRGGTGIVCPQCLLQRRLPTAAVD
jgi:hypothetical protein